jgi:dTDP-4-dehydrorhamnose reductase
MDVFVIGASGLLGSNVISGLLDRGHEVASCYHSTEPEFDIPLRELDIRNTDAYRSLIDEFGPEVVVNCGAMTDVDKCEQQPDRAHEINARAPEMIAKINDRRNIEFIHISTDYVFDGRSSEKYHEDSKLNPIQEYGRSKKSGEDGVLSAHSSPLVIRPSFIYGLDRSQKNPTLEGFPAWVQSRISSGKKIPLFTDQYITPSRAGSTASALLELFEHGAKGIYHVAARSCVTPYDFGRHLVNEMSETEATLVESSQEDINRTATRPVNTCLSVRKVENKLARSQPELEQDISALVEFL